MRESCIAAVDTMLSLVELWVEGGELPVDWEVDDSVFGSVMVPLRGPLFTGLVSSASTCSTYPLFTVM